MSPDRGTIKKYEDKQVVFEEGERGDRMYVVRSGYVRIFRTRGGKNIEYGIIGPGEFFGEMAMFAEHKRSASAQAKGVTELSIIDVDNFLNRVSDPLVLNVIRKLSERIREIDDRIEGMIMQDQIRKEHLSSLITHSRRIY
jgi:CRP/FNR family transcriptional regulator, cyclic AMP receptor protein